MSRRKRRAPAEPADKVKARLIDALIELLRERSVADISVRDVAAAAGVNHGLVHRHFGSKEGLVRAAVTRLSSEVHMGRPERDGASWTYRLLRERPEIALVVARCCLDGPRDLLPLAAPPPDRLAAIVAPIRAALARLGPASAADAHVLNALGTAALLGWFVFRPLLADGYGLPADADRRLGALLGRFDAVLAALAPPE